MPALEEITVGQVATMTHTVTGEVIDTFARLTGDFNSVHVDEAAAARSRFGGRIAHGMLGAGFISATIGTQLPGPGCIYLGQTLRFTLPVRIGDVVTTQVEVLEVNARKRRVRLATRCTNQDGKTVIDGEATVLVPADQQGSPAAP